MSKSLPRMSDIVAIPYESSFHPPSPMKLAESGLDTGEIERDFELHKESLSLDAYLPKPCVGRGKSLGCQ